MAMALFEEHEVVKSLWPKLSREVFVPWGSDSY
jgi:hypothetical protein